MDFFIGAPLLVVQFLGPTSGIISDESVPADILFGFSVDCGGFVLYTSECAEAWESGLIKNAILEEIESRGRRDGLDRDRGLLKVADSRLDKVIEF